MKWTGAVAGALAVGFAVTASAVEFDSVELRLVLRHGPWPQPVLRDASNRASGDPAAIALGERLFFDPRLSGPGTIACASCHIPAQAWTDGHSRAIGLAPLDRNTPTVLDAGLQRWFGWDGAADSLWSFVLQPITDPREMGSSARAVGRLVRTDPELACRYERAFGEAVGEDDERTLVDVGKALAAYAETLTSSRPARGHQAPAIEPLQPARAVQRRPDRRHRREDAPCRAQPRELRSVQDAGLA